MLKEDDYTNTIGHLHFTPIPAAAATDFVSSDLTNGGCLRSVGVEQEEKEDDDEVEMDPPPTG